VKIIGYYTSQLYTKMVSKGFDQIVFEASRSLGALVIAGGIITGEHSELTLVYDSPQFVSRGKLVAACPSEKP
jgi:hypothetical protein